MPDANAPKEFRNKFIKGKFTLYVISEGRALTKPELIYAAGFFKQQMGWKKFPTVGTWTTRFSPPEGFLQTQSSGPKFPHTFLD
mgnify:CR=1 FL=1